MSWGSLFCSRKKLRSQILCKQCGKLLNDSVDMCGHKESHFLLMEHSDLNLNLNVNLTKGNAFELFSLIQLKGFTLPELEFLKISFQGSVQSWVIYHPSPWDRSFETWKGYNQKMPSLSRLVLDFSNARGYESVHKIFANIQEQTSLESLEIILFGTALNQDQLGLLFEQIGKINNLKELSLSLDKAKNINVSENLVSGLEGTINKLKKLNQLSLGVASLLGMGVPNGQFTRLLSVISKIPRLNKLKLSFKNTEIRESQISDFSSFLVKLSPYLIHLDIDLSYNSELQGTLTQQICKALSQCNSLKYLAINLKGLDHIFSLSDYFLLMRLVEQIFSHSSEQYLQYNNISLSKVKGIQFQLPLAFIRQNLALYRSFNRLIQVMLHHGPILYSKLKHSYLSSFFRKEVLIEIFQNFLI